MAVEKKQLRRRGAAVEQAILEATLDELSERGTSGARIHGIAARAGVNEATVYRRYGSKEGLFQAALLQRIDEILPAPDTGTFRGDLHAIVHGVWELYQTPSGAALVRGSPMAIAAELSPDERLTFWRARADQLRVVVQRAKERGEVAADTNTWHVLELLVAPLHSRIAVTGLELDPSMPDWLADAVARACRPT